MEINGVRIEDTYAEGFRMFGARFIITAASNEWVMEAASKATGFATSVIACGCEADVESVLTSGPDGRPAVSVLVFAASLEQLEKQALDRIGQCVMTCPTTALFDGFEKGGRIQIGSKLRYFGDGRQSSKLIGGRRFWRIPVMEGEFLVEESIGFFSDGVDGNLLILGDSLQNTLAAAEKAVIEMRKVPGVILPFPGGVVRSGSKVGSKYKELKASTYHAFCPTLKNEKHSLLPHDVNCTLEIVVCAVNEAALYDSMYNGINAACQKGIKLITAGNYGGTLGQLKIHLHDVLKRKPAKETNR